MERLKRKRKRVDGQKVSFFFFSFLLVEAKAVVSRAKWDIDNDF